MKSFFSLIILFFLVQSVFATGVVINKNAASFQPLYLSICHYDAAIQNQVAAVTITETFKNTFTTTVEPRYYFPLPSGASATQLRWFVHGNWYHASIAGNPAGLPGGPSVLPDYFKLYIGFFPVGFDFSTTLAHNEEIIVELTYVQLLNYSLGNVNLFLKNDYTPIQTQPLAMQQLDITLESDRTIQSFVLNNTAATIEFNGQSAYAHLLVSNAIANSNYSLDYSLAQNEIGFRAMSTVCDSVPDMYGNGFFTFIVEPANTGTVNSLPLKLTLVVDHSGSMNFENRIVQARNAMIYIINHLGANDKFNVIAFDHQVQHLWTSHHPVTSSNITTATTWINAISAVAPNGTNISGALDEAIQEFQNASSAYHNVIILITDGGPTVGITDTYQLVNHVDALINSMDVDLSLFNFGVGSDVNSQLLTMLAQDNNGAAIFLGSSELYATVTSFFNMISQAVILAPVLTITPNNALSEIYPYPLPSLYHDSQLVITGRYNIGQGVNLLLEGTDSNGAVSYQYEAGLTTENDSIMQFIPKLWASKKIDHLLVDYYSYPSNSTQALALKEEIITISESYGVVCVFTSFTGNTGNQDDVAEHIAQPVLLIGNFPNPFNPETEIRFTILTDIKEPVFVEIFNIKGQLVRNLATRVNGKGDYGIFWNGMNNKGKKAVSGVYFYKIRIGKYLLTGKMTILK